MSSVTARLRANGSRAHRASSRRPARSGIGRRSRSGPPRWVWTLAVAAVIVLSAVAFTTTFLELYRLQREADRLIRMRTALQQESAALREEIRALHTPEYIERIAREQLGLVKPGEIVLLIVTPPKPAPAPPPQPPEETSWLEQFLRAIAGLFGR